MLKNNEGSWIEDENDIANLFQEFYMELFYEDKVCRKWVQTEQRWGEVPEETWRRMEREVDKEEIKQAFFQMGAFKAPGSDGFPAAFFAQ